jgi:CheY-like chemotaxis protein/HPt (histidine-containing phosphotransfer) domain-containing protein
MDGFTVAQNLKADGGTEAPTVMMLTSSGEPQDSVRCQTLGISSYLIKPVRQAALLDSILTTLGRNSARHIRQTAARKNPSTSLRILLAEDNVVNQRVAMGLLQNSGHLVTLAENGRKAVDAFIDQKFDLVLMDMQMPEMGGAEAMSLIRAHEREHGGHIPIISLTAHALNGDRERCLDAGADGYVSKPIAPAILFQEMETVLTVDRPGHIGPAQEKAVPVSDNDLLARVGGSQELLREVIGLFLEDCPKLVAVLGDAIRRGDTDAVYRASHTLKGSVGNFDAHAAMQIAQRLEARAREGNLEAATTIFAALEVEIHALLAALAKNGALSCAS